LNSNVVLDGCLVSLCSAGNGGDTVPYEAYPGGNGGYGGGVSSESSSVTITNSNISQNTSGTGAEGDAIADSGDGGYGGGIYCDDTSSVNIDNSTIQDNEAVSAGNVTATIAGRSGWGGGIYSLSPELLVHGSTIQNNKAADAVSGTDNGGSGGGIYCTTAVVTDSEIISNSSGNGGTSYDGGSSGGDGGGIYCESQLDISGSTISSNTTGLAPAASWEKGNGGNGAGIFGGPGSTLTINNCVIENNITGKGADSGIHAPGTNGHGGSGGGVYGAEVVITNSTIYNNITGAGGMGDIDQGGNGGFGAGIYSLNSLIAANCAILDNTTGDGGSSVGVGGNGGNGAGIYCVLASSVLVQNCTIAYNITGEAGSGFPAGDTGYGGGIYGNLNTEVVDSIFWSNMFDQLYGHDCSNITYCDIQDGECSGSTGNIASDPNFVTGPKGDYYLSQTDAGQSITSPCVDAGSDTAMNLGMWEYTTRTDEVGDLSVVDMGYHYHYQIGDINRDTKVNLIDFTMLSNNWAQRTPLEILSGSCTVDGDLGDWPADSMWRSLDQVYYGDPADVSNAEYALCWDETTHKIYAAVKVEDANHIFSDVYGTWNTSDRIEVHSQATAAGGTGWFGIYDIAQHYMVAPDTSTDSWAVLGDGLTVNPDMGLEYAVTVNGPTIKYEIGVTQFDNYGGISGGSTNISSLYEGEMVGFDIIASTRWATDFGMLSENLMTNKSTDADQFAKYILVNQTTSKGYTPLIGDIDEDSYVNLADLALMLRNWLYGVY
jgi:hypothetical protein